MKIDQACFAASYWTLSASSPTILSAPTPTCPSWAGPSWPTTTSRAGAMTSPWPRPRSRPRWSSPASPDVQRGDRHAGRCRSIRLPGGEPARLAAAGRPDPRLLARATRDKAHDDPCRDRGRAAQHHHPHRPAARRRTMSWTWYCATTSPPPEHPLGPLPPPRRAAPHQKGEHRPDRSDGPGRAARPAQGRAGGGGRAPRGRGP